MLKADFSKTMTLINSIPAKEKINVEATNVVKTVIENSFTSERASWTYLDWAKKDEKGLLNMKKNNYGMFRQLHINQYGVEPSI
jgi:hypothetical protein